MQMQNKIISHPALSRREKQVAEYYSLSFKPKEIGEILNISRKAASQYLYAIRQKYGLTKKDNLRLVLEARSKAGLLFND